MTAWRSAPGKGATESFNRNLKFRLAYTAFCSDSFCLVTPEQRAKAIIEHFAASLPPGIRSQLEEVIARAINRALKEQLGKLERWAAVAEERAHGKGKSAKGYDPSAIHWNNYWKETFR